MNLIQRLLFSALILLLGTLPALAAPIAHNENASLQLVIDPADIRSGESFFVAVDFDLKDSWHIYWKNPGDSGLETQLDWTLPEGFSAGPIHWPYPERIEYSGLFNYGYHGDVGLLVPVTAPENLSKGPIEFAVNVEYLICSDICIPEEASLSISVTPGISDEAAGERLALLQTRLPAPYDGRAEYDVNGNHVFFAFDLLPTSIELERIFKAWFYPLDAQVISNASEQDWRLDGAALIIHTEREGTAAPETFKGVLEVATTDGQRFYLQTGPSHSPSSIAESGDGGKQPTEGEANRDHASAAETTLLWALLSAFLGGIILNIMPCVLPVLSLKALSIAQKSGSDRGNLRVQGIAYTAGIVVSFLAVTGTLIAIQQAGQSIGWGFQLQEIGFVSALIYLLFLIGLNLSGVYELPSRMAGMGGSLTQNSGASGSFFTGVLATIVATPCTAPFMATAIGFALSQSAITALLIFTALGLGLAFPFLLITFIPGATRFLPKPGPWMETFKQFLAFPIYATVIWLLWVLTQQAGAMGLLHTLSGLLLIGFAIWLIGKCQTRIMQMLLMVVSLIGLFLITDTTPLPEGNAKLSARSEAFSQATIDAYLAQGRPVFVNATAAWCITCKVNERVALKDPSVLAAIEANDVAYIVADWTNRNTQIADYLASFDRSGVPLYVYYAPGKEPVLLPQLLTPSIVLEHINPH